MDFLAVLDYEHLDNGVFLNTFAKVLSRKKKRGLIIHGDSEYTERIIQTGVMRNEAQIRAIKELNHRLVALFADEGVSTIALNGFQKSLLKVSDDHLQVDKKQIEMLPNQPMVLLSNLCWDLQTDTCRPVPLSDLALVMAREFMIDTVTIFSKEESSGIIKQDFPGILKIDETDAFFVQKHIPKKLQTISFPIRLCTASTF